MTILLIAVFCLAILFSMTLTRVVRNLARHYEWLDTPLLDRHVHTTPMPRIGGVAIFMSFAAVILGFSLISTRLHLNLSLPFNVIRGLVGPALLIIMLGLYDDFRGASPYVKFLVEGLAATLLFFAGYGVHRLDLISPNHPLQTIIGLPITILWVLLITNAFNLIDGLDGLAAGSALFSAVVVFILASLYHNLAVIIFASALAGSILGFLRFNFHPASIFLGDSGSLFLGFMLSALGLMGSQKAPTMIAVTIPLIALGLPILDVALAIIRRFLRGHPLFKGDRDHIHHKLLERGLSQREVVLLLYAITAGFSFVSLLILHRATVTALILAATAIAVLFGVHQLRYRELGEMFSVIRRSTRRRQYVANQIAIRRSIDSLNCCKDFQSICRVLQSTFQPIGFDGLRLQMFHPNGYPPTAFHPMSYEPDGKLLLSWSESEIDQPPWELRLELFSSSCQPWGYFSLVRASGDKPIAVDVNCLTFDFCAALSRAVDNACRTLESNIESMSA